MCGFDLPDLCRRRGKDGLSRKAAQKGNGSVKIETTVLVLAASAALSLASMGTAAGETGNWPYQSEVQDEGQKETGQRRKIGKINLVFDADLGIGNNGKQISVTAEGSSRELYSIEDTQVVNEEWEFSNANPPELEITLVSGDEDLWYFSSSASSDFRLKLAETSKNRYEKVKFVSAKRQEDNSVLTLRVQLLFDKDADTRKSPAVSQSPASGFGWDSGEKGRAVWNPEASARYYQVQLIHNGGAVGIVRSVYQNYYDFSKQVTEPGAYQFQVRTVSEASHRKSEWTMSDVLTVKTDGSFVVAKTYEGAGWQKTKDGLHWWWRNEDGTRPVSQWMEQGGRWYYFDDQGYMVTGWLCLDGLWYYLDRENGDLYVNCRTPDHYWVGPDGIYVPGK